MNLTLHRAIPVAVLLLLGGSDSAWSQSPPPMEPPRQALPSIQPGEVRSMSIQDVQSEAKPYFTHEQERYLEKNQKSAGGVAYRVVDTSESAVHLLDRLAEKATPSVDSKLLSAKAVEVTDEAIAQSERIGIIAERGSGEEFTRLSRLYRTKDAKIVMISEWDYLADGGGIVQFSEYVNSAVRGTPAVLTVKRAAAEALWHLSWTTPRKDFGIYLYESKFDSRSADVLHRLAEALME